MNEHIVVWEDIVNALYILKIRVQTFETLVWETFVSTHQVFRLFLMWVDIVNALPASNYSRLLENHHKSRIAAHRLL